MWSVIYKMMKDFSCPKVWQHFQSERKSWSQLFLPNFFPQEISPSPPKPTSFCTAKSPHLSDCRILWETTKSQRAVTGARYLVAFLLRSVNRSIWTRPRSWVPSSWRLPAPAVKTQGATYHLLNISAQFCDGWFIHGGGPSWEFLCFVFLWVIWVSSIYSTKQMLFYIAHLSSSTWAQGKWMHFHSRIQIFWEKQKLN